MNNSIQNRKFPVFFVSNRLLIILAVLLVVSCKSRTDWRDKKAPATTTKIKIEKPENLSDISKFLDVEESTLKNKKLYNFIIDWYGTPYKYGGATKQGIDCSGFTSTLFQEIYTTAIPRISKDIAENVTRKYTKDLIEGDLVFFSFGKSGIINHVGIYLHNNKFVHASTSKGVIISNLSELHYGNYLVKCGSYKN